MPMRALLLSLGFAVALAGCQRDAADTTTPTPAKSPVTASTSHDALSYAAPGKVAITDLSLYLRVDFDTNTITGTPPYTLVWKDAHAPQLSHTTRPPGPRKPQTARHAAAHPPPPHTRPPRPPP